MLGRRATLFFSVGSHTNSKKHLPLQVLKKPQNSIDIFRKTAYTNKKACTAGQSVFVNRSTAMAKTVTKEAILSTIYYPWAVYPFTLFSAAPQLSRHCPRQQNREAYPKPRCRKTQKRLKAAGKFPPKEIMTPTNARPAKTGNTRTDPMTLPFPLRHPQSLARKPLLLKSAPMRQNTYPMHGPRQTLPMIRKSFPSP